MSNVLEEVLEVQKSIEQIRTDIVRIDEKLFRDNLLPILLHKENHASLKYVVGITGSPFLGAWITRDGKDAYEMPALFDKRFDRSNLTEVASDGMGEKADSIEKEGRRSARRQLQEEKAFFGSIKGLFKDDTVLDTQEKWTILFKENGIDVYEHFGIGKNDSKKQSQETRVAQEWDDEGDEEL